MKTQKMMVVLCMSFLMITSLDLVAQRGNRPMNRQATNQKVSRPINKQANLKDQKELIEAQKYEHVVAFLELTPTEAEQYKKITSEAKTKENAMRVDFRKEMIDFNSKKWNELTDKEAEDILAMQETHFSLMSKHRQETLAKLKKIMPVSKVAKIKQAELDYRRTIVREARQNRQYYHNRPDRQHRNWLDESPSEE